MPEDSDKPSWRQRFTRGPRTPMSPARRRLIVRLGVAAVLVAALVLVPGYISTRPAFLQRYANLDATYRTWSGSVHAKVPCQKCHVRPGLVAQSRYSARMLGEFYLSLVARGRSLDVLRKPSNAACSACHIDLRTVSPSGDLRIPHRAHVDVLKLDCVRCHEYLVHQKSPEGKHLPRMAACLDCHDGKQAENGCSACHTEKAAPKNHAAADWVVVHPTKQRELDCTKCHKWREDWCADCHTRRPRSHAGKWRSRHPEAVEKRRNCEACHKAAFCVRCHGEVPSLNFDPTLKLVR